MARFLRFVIPGQPQHVIQRDNNRQAIFRAEADYSFFMVRRLNEIRGANACEIPLPDNPPRTEFPAVFFTAGFGYPRDIAATRAPQPVGRESWIRRVCRNSYAARDQPRRNSGRRG